MKALLITKENVEAFAKAHANSRPAFDQFLDNVKEADWETPADIKKAFPSADILGNGSNRAVIDIGGNNYRMIIRYQFGGTKVRLYLKWIGTHAEYDELCKKKLQYTVSKF